MTDQDFMTITQGLCPVAALGDEGLQEALEKAQSIDNGAIIVGRLEIIEEIKSEIIKRWPRAVRQVNQFAEIVQQFAEIVQQVNKLAGLSELISIQREELIKSREKLALSEKDRDRLRNLLATELRKP